MAHTIGRFEIRGELGRGAQSVVYLAWDPQLQREVAIKTLHFDGSDAQVNGMLLAEARTVSRLRHPNVVPIFDVGEQDGDPYLVFEYVEGSSLAEALKSDGPLAAARAAEMMRQVLDALAQAHAQGIIHRDLKPSNILIDGRGTPRVMDFGIAARVADGAGRSDEGLTGTPAYMAPEYVAQRIISERMDVYAAGLVLLEMLTGRRAVAGTGVKEILRRVAGEPVRLPPDVPIDERLGSIVLRACAREPLARYASAAEMRQALHAYLNADQPTAETAGTGKGRSTLEFLLRRMRHKSDFPALSDSISAINKLTSSERESIGKLSDTILKDYALTNKILRLVNSAYYRQAGGGNISTVTRAAIVLGFDAIRNIAITVLLFEHLQDKANAKDLKEAFLRANLAALLARDASQALLPREGEEGFICALFHDLGRLLAQYYFPEEIEEVKKLMDQKGIRPDQAAVKVLGISFEDLGIGIARNWGFPAGIVGSMRRLPTEGAIRKPATREEALRVVASFGNELCDAIAAAAPEERNKVLNAVADRYGPSIQMTDAQIQAVVEKSRDELGQVAAILHVNLQQSPFVRQVRAFTGALRDDAQDTLAGGDTLLTETGLERTVLADTTLLSEEEAAPTVDAQAILAAGIQDISNSLVEDFALNDVLRIVLETMYRAMGFKRVLLCLKDVRANQMVGRFGFGPDIADLTRVFRFPLAQTADVFHLATAKGLDLNIADIDDPKIAVRIPDWYRNLMPAKTFVLFPLTIKGNPVALIYCDKDKAGSIVIPEKELTLLKTLRNQAMLAIKQSN